MALRRLEPAAFGTLMSLEPAAALLVGIVVLGQTPHPIQALGVLLVVVAAGGAAQSGRRVGAPAKSTSLTSRQGH